LTGGGEKRVQRTEMTGMAFNSIVRDLLAKGKSLEKGVKVISGGLGGGGGFVVSNPGKMGK